MSVKVYQLANDLDMSSKDVIVLLRERGLKVTSASSSIPNIYADALIEELASRPTNAALEKTEGEGPEGAAMPNSPELIGPFVESQGNLTNGADNRELSTPAWENDSSPKPMGIAADCGEGEISEVKTASENKTVAVEGMERKEGKLKVIEPGISLNVPDTAKGPSKAMGVPSPEMIIKIPLPKGAPKVPILFVAKEQNRHPEKVADPKVSLSPKESYSGGEKSTAAKVSEIPAEKSVTPDPNAINTPNYAWEVKRKAPMVNFREKRAAPMVRFQFTPKSQHGEPALKIPDISGANPAKNNAEKVRGNKPLVCKAPLIVRDFAQKIELKPFQLISELMRRGIFASMNQQIPDNVALSVAEKYGFELEIRQKPDGTKQNIPKV